MEKLLNNKINALLENSDNYMKAIKEVEIANISLESKSLLLTLLKKESKNCNINAIKLMADKNKIPLDI